MRIPREIERWVVAHLYSQAEKIDWGSMSTQEHSAQYGKWVDAPEVGGRLTQYLSVSDARVWIKDGPMKEWSRAKSGFGKYAGLIDGAGDVQASIVRKALGSDWVPDLASVRGKPLRIVARATDETETVVAWGPPADLKHLAWAALVAQADGDSRDWVLCVVETLTNPTPQNDKVAHKRVAQRCGLRIVHVTL